MISKSQHFKQLHHNAEPLLIGNVWNVQSAKIFEDLGFKAIATSSAAVAETLGYADGEEMSFEDYLLIIRSIARNIPVPLSVDLEAGYGSTVETIVENIKRLTGAGIAGINIEDSMVLNGNRSIVNAEAFASKIATITNLLSRQGLDIFINLRCDVYLLGMEDPVTEAMKRIDLYATTGADGLFFPCITDIKEIETLAAATRLPLNVMCMPELPDFTSLKNAGIKRISMGNFLNKKIYQGLGTEVKQILSNNNFISVFQ
jgi:2-methylisocitrate lyase-like PEP mutase family enzyme